MRRNPGPLCLRDPPHEEEPRSPLPEGPPHVGGSANPPCLSGSTGLRPRLPHMGHMALAPNPPADPLPYNPSAPPPSTVRPCSQVCAGGTGHNEVVRVVFDPSECPYESLLDAFFGKHDPPSLNRQGNDEGEQYRSGIYFSDEEQREAAAAAIARENERLGGQVRLCCQGVECLGGHVRFSFDTCRVMSLPSDRGGHRSPPSAPACRS